MRIRTALFIVVAILVVATSASAGGPAAHVASTCADYANQAEAQRAADTRDPDGDGIYCESLPCPCAGAGGSGGGDPPPGSPPPNNSCTRPKSVQRITFSRSKYANIRRHYISAVGKGWPRILVINRAGTSARRDKLLADVPTKDGYDRDEYPPAVGRGRGSRALKRGINPTGWLADVEYVPSGENRSHGSSLGSKLRPFCNGTRFRYIFR
jgi:hypothetical protein